ncbi:MAG: hypothetical protein PHR68_03815 [Candidatus Gracilibacteria bacterium]|nr:hypothetical protein [Candidatus Gracilibacteria bacterium]
MEKFYNSDGNPEMYKKCIKHISFSRNLGLSKTISENIIEVVKNFILVLDDFTEKELNIGEQIEIIPLENL